MSDYIETKSGKKLKRHEAQFFYRGKRFCGLIVDNSLYDDPDDSFAGHVGITSSLEMGLIAVDEDATKE